MGGHRSKQPFVDGRFDGSIVHDESVLAVWSWPL
jgi:hypothetical protein